MTDFQVVAVILTLTAVLAYVNARVLRLPSAIGLMATALLASIAGLALDAAGVTERRRCRGCGARRRAPSRS